MAWWWLVPLFALGGVANLIAVESLYTTKLNFPKDIFRRLGVLTVTAFLLWPMILPFMLLCLTVFSWVWPMPRGGGIPPRPPGDYLTAEQIATLAPPGRFRDDGPENPNCYFCGEPTKMRAYTDLVSGNSYPAYCSRSACLDKLDAHIDAQVAAREVKP